MMTRRSVVFTEELFELLRGAVAAASSVTDVYAIGGAAAMAVHRFARHTSSVDLFIDDGAQAGVLRALRTRGFRVTPVTDGLRYTAQRPGEQEPDARIDIIVACDEPDWSAVAAPDHAMLDDLKFNVFPPELLVVSMFYGADDPQHLADIYRMFHRAAFDPARARAVLQAMDPERIPEWDAAIADIERPRAQSQKPRRRKP